ncbi:MAG: hypothetical protein LBM02_04025 [Lachnospiraceae bacterium]|jgi:hypothetical protein|nr:hypothetical protein [Lachnospiraceae bacterium]
MKKVKITSILLSVLMLVLLVCGCSAKPTAESLLKNGNKKLSDAKSLDMDLKGNFDIQMTISGYNASVKAGIDTNFKYANESKIAYMKGNVNYEMLGISKKLPIELYEALSEKSIETWTKIDNASKWEYAKQTADLSKYFGKEDVMSLYGNLDTIKDKFELKKDKEEYNKTDCYVVSGKITGADLKKSITDKDTKEVIDELYNQYNLKDLSFDVKYYFDGKTKEPVAIKIDMAKGIADLWKGIKESGKLPTEYKDADLSAKTMTFELIINSTNKNNDLKVPQEVKDNSNKSTDAASDFSSILS